MKEFIVHDEEENQRIDKYILKILNKGSKSLVYKMFRKKNIKLNNHKINGNEIIKTGDVIHIYFSNETFDKFSSSENSTINTSQSFNVIYEDDKVLVVNKPAGLLSQPDGTNDNLVDQINAYLKSDDAIQTTFQVGICNRLDRNTSGIIIAGKSIKSLQQINEAIKSRNVDKIYHCIVKGNLKTQGILEGYLSKNQQTNRVEISQDKQSGSYIKTLYKPINKNELYTLLEVKIITGKSHQIRAHLGSIGHPIIGDQKYGDKKINEVLYKKFKLKHQLLHGYRYTFNEISEPLSYLEGKAFIAPYPDEFKNIKDALL